MEGLQRTSFPSTFANNLQSQSNNPIVHQSDTLRNIPQFLQNKPIDVIIADCHKPPKVNQMKHILILLSLLILTLPLVAQETGVLYFKKVNGKYGWFENGNDKKDWKYIGEIKNGKPNGTGGY